MFTDPGHVILLALVVAIVAGIYLVYLVSRRRRNVGHQIDHLDDDRHPAGHGRQHGPGHGAADPERHHP